MSSGRIRPPEWTIDAPISAGTRDTSVARSDHARVRACVFVAAVAVGVLAAPAIARADPGPSTTDQLLQQAGAAMNTAQALASQEVAATSSAVSAAMARTPASAPPSVANAQHEVTKAVSDAIATAAAASASSPAATAAVPQKPVLRIARHHHHRAAPYRRHTAARNASAPYSDRAAAGTSSLRPIGLALPIAPRWAATPGRGSTTRHRSARAVPHHRLPPLPVPPQGSSGNADAAGSGTPAPLLVVVLGAALFLILFEILSRLLPRSAFRKPRRLALPPWHPG